MIQFLENHDRQLSEVISENLKWCSDFDFAVAYLTNSGFYILADYIIDFLELGGSIRMLVDLESGFTDYNSILEFATIKGNCKCKVFIRDEKVKIGQFHPKLYIFKRDYQIRAIVGSSNFTSGGMIYNYEANISVDESRINTKCLRNIYAYFERIWNYPYSLPVIDCLII